MGCYDWARESWKSFKCGLCVVRIHPSSVPALGRYLHFFRPDWEPAKRVGRPSLRNRCGAPGLCPVTVAPPDRH